MLNITACSTTNSIPNAKIIYPDNEALSYSGRIDFSDISKPIISWSGTSISTRFTGTSVAVVLEDQEGNNFFNVIIDGNDKTPYILSAKQGYHKYLITTTLSDNDHELEIYKRTEGADGVTIFHGLELEHNAKVFAVLEKKTRKIEFFGDSITSGLGIDADPYAGDNDIADKNHYVTYAALVGRALNADVHTISKSGIGLMSNYVGYIDYKMPDYYAQLHGYDNNNSKWDFSSWTPDVVVMNLLQNDKWIYESLETKPTEAEIIEKYVAFVRKLRATYPNAHIICALGSMDATKSGSPWPGYVSKATEIMKNKYNDNKISTVFFPFNGYEAHPRREQNRENAKILEEEIRKLMNWN